MSLVKCTPCFCGSCFSFPSPTSVETTPTSVTVAGPIIAMQAQLSQSFLPKPSAVLQIQYTIHTFESELTNLFFSYLGLADLGKCSEVSKLWNANAIELKKPLTTLSCFVANRDDPYYRFRSNYHRFVNVRMHFVRYSETYWAAISERLPPADWRLTHNR